PSRSRPPEPAAGSPGPKPSHPAYESATYRRVGYPARRWRGPCLGRAGRARGRTRFCATSGRALALSRRRFPSQSSCSSPGFWITVVIGGGFLVVLFYVFFRVAGFSTLLLLCPPRADRLVVNLRLPRDLPACGKGLAYGIPGIPLSAANNLPTSGGFGGRQLCKKRCLALRR